MTDFISDVGTHSAGVLAEIGKRHMQNNPMWDQLRTAVGNWLEEAEVVLDLDGIRAALSALSLVLTRMDVYDLDDAAKFKFREMLAEVSATLVDIHENPRVQLEEPT